MYCFGNFDTTQRGSMVIIHPLCHHFFNIHSNFYVWEWPPIGKGLAWCVPMRAEPVSIEFLMVEAWDWPLIGAIFINLSKRWIDGLTQGWLWIGDGLADWWWIDGLLMNWWIGDGLTLNWRKWWCICRLVMDWRIGDGLMDLSRIDIGMAEWWWIGGMVSHWWIAAELVDWSRIDIGFADWWWIDIGLAD